MEELEKEIQEENQQEPEKSYILNKGLPRFVGDTEFKRLRAVIDEKNALIEKFKAYDEERKAYYKDIQNLVDKLTEEKKALHEENAKLCKTIEKLRKKQEPLFAPELRQLMETGEMTDVTLECRDEIAEVIRERFGREADIWRSTQESFYIKVPISVSPAFYGWVFRFGGMIRIVSPATVREAYLRKASDIIKTSRSKL